VAVDYLLKIDGIKGDSNQKGQEGAIEIESFSWGASNPATAALGGGGGAGKVSFQDVHFVAQTSKASPSLFLACASGMHFNKAVLTARKAGEKQDDFLIISLTDILVSGYQSGGSEGSDIPTDQFSINFSTVQFQVKGQDDAGVPNEGVTVGWDLKKNLKL
jgi:type VI secretion system secreted protein Hcp